MGEKLDNQKIDSIQSNYNSKKENTFLYEKYSSKLESLKESNLTDPETIKSINNILEKLESENQIKQIGEYIREIEKLSKGFKAKKAEVTTETQEKTSSLLPKKETETQEKKTKSGLPILKKPNQKEVEKQEEKTQEKVQEVLKTILEKNKGRLDYGVSKIENLMDSAEKMDETTLKDEIHSLWLPFDVEYDDEWDMYFKENNISDEERKKFKKIFSNLTSKNIDAGNLFRDDIGDEIDNEATRILNLKSGEKISINHKEFTDGNEIVFETKKDALLFLYYNKLLLREVATSFTDIGIGISNTGIAIGNGISFLANNPEAILWGIAGYMGLSASGTAFRKINGWYISKAPNGIFGKFKGKGVYLEENTSLAGQVEKAELDKRNKKLDELKAHFADNDPRIKDLEKWLFIADGQNSNDSKKGFIDSTFWRKVKNIENPGVFSNKWFDTYGKLFLLNSETGVGKLNNLARLVRNDIFSDVETGELKKGSFLYNAEQNLLLSHDIKDSDEEDLKRIIDTFKEDIKNNPGKFKGKNRSEVIKDIKNQLLDAINSKLDEKGSPRIYRIFEDDKLVNIKDSFKTLGLGKTDDIVNHIKTDKDLADILSQNPTRETNLKNFLNSLYATDAKNYSSGTATDIIYRIIHSDISYTSAITESFENRTSLEIKDLYRSGGIIDSLNEMKNKNYDLGKGPERLKQERILELKKYNERLTATIEKSGLNLQEKRGLLLKARLLENEILTNSSIGIETTYNKFVTDNNLGSLLSEDDAKEHFNSKTNKLKKIKENIDYSIGKKYNSTKNLVSDGVEKVSTLRTKKEIKKYYNKVLASLELSNLLDSDKIQTYNELKKVSKKVDFSSYESEISQKINKKFTILSENDIKKELTDRVVHINTLKSMGLQVDITGHEVTIKGLDPINSSKLSPELSKTYKFLKYLSKAL